LHPRSRAPWSAGSPGRITVVGGASSVYGRSATRSTTVSRDEGASRHATQPTAQRSAQSSRRMRYSTVGLTPKTTGVLLVTPSARNSASQQVPVVDASCARSGSTGGTGGNAGISRLSPCTFTITLALPATPALFPGGTRLRKPSYRQAVIAQ